MNNLDTQNAGIKALLACAQILVRTGEIQGIGVVVAHNGAPPVFCQAGTIDQITSRHARYLDEQLHSISLDRWHLEPTNDILWPDSLSPCVTPNSHCAFRGVEVGENTRITLLVAHATAGSLARALGVLVNHFSVVVKSLVASHWLSTKSSASTGKGGSSISSPETTSLVVQYMKRISESVDDIVLALDAQGGIVYLNRSAHRWFSDLGLGNVLDQTESGSSKVPMVNLIHAQDVQLFMQRFTHTIVNSSEASVHLRWRNDANELPCDTDTLLQAIPDQLVQMGDETNTARVILFVKPKSSLQSVSFNYSRQHDAVTGLVTQAVLEDNLVHSLLDQIDQPSVALAFLDIGGFEVINHNHGSKGGDVVLAELARRIEAAVPDSAMIARFRGCRFAAIFEGVYDQASAYELGQRLSACLSEQFMLNGIAIKLNGSSGIALSSRKIQTSQALIRAAEQAVFDSNTQHNGSTVVFSEELSASMQMRDLLSKSILGATTRGEIEIYYQPIYALRDQAIIGGEALVRWNHPTLGMIQPSDFIPIAESTGIILELDEWILRSACIQGAKWAAYTGHEFRIGVNISKNQFAAPGFVDAVRVALDQSGLPADQLTIEFTEAALEASGSSGALVMESLQAMGIGLTLDDFGVGGASLMHLLQFNLDRIKLDRKFVASVPHDERGSALVLSILNMCLIMNICVTAEGIENADQLKYLFEMGCFEGQGYHLSPPIPAARFEQLLIPINVKAATNA